jgi:hypothetical protein
VSKLCPQTRVLSGKSRRPGDFAFGGERRSSGFPAEDGNRRSTGKRSSAWQRRGILPCLDQICSSAQLFSPRLCATFERKPKYEYALKIAACEPVQQRGTAAPRFVLHSPAKSNRWFFWRFAGRLEFANQEIGVPRGARAARRCTRITNHASPLTNHHARITQFLIGSTEIRNRRKRMNTNGGLPF